MSRLGRYRHATHPPVTTRPSLAATTAVAAALTLLALDPRITGWVLWLVGTGLVLAGAAVVITWPR